MKSVIVTQEQLDNPQELAKALFLDPQDPRSTVYVRKLERPKINWLWVTLFLLCPVAVGAALIVAACSDALSVVAAVCLGTVFLAVYTALTLKKAIICAVRIYQRYAPAAIRNKCRFEPSCSEYMILSVQKYGVWKGVRKGKNRLKRCNIDHGGFDYP